MGDMTIKQVIRKHIYILIKKMALLKAIIIKKKLEMEETLYKKGCNLLVDHYQNQ